MADINREKLMQAMYHRAFETDGDTMWMSGCWVRYRAIEDVIKSQPEQPEIIRCKDCAYCIIDQSDGLPYCPEFYERTVEPDDYCSKAVRR